MMGPIAGSADNISELKKLLELASDPKQSLEVLAKMEAAQAEGKRLNEEKAVLEASIAFKLKNANETLDQVNAEKAKFATLAQDVVHRQSALAAALASHKDQREKFNKELDTFEAQKAAFKKRVSDYEAEAASDKGQLDKAMFDVKAMKAEYEAKLSQLKQITG